MNQVLYEKVSTRGEEIFVFVQSRKGAAKTACLVRDMAVNYEILTQFVNLHSVVRGC